MVAITTLALLATCTLLSSATPIEPAIPLDERAIPLERAGTHGTDGAATYVNTRSCPGSKIDSGPVGKSGHWYLYYSSANGGTNCLFVDNKTGRTAYTMARIEVTKTSYAWYAGDYKQYAGSVRVHKAAGKCVEVFARVGNEHVFKGPFHCK